jgi:hypothetical protein
LHQTRAQETLPAHSASFSGNLVPLALASLLLLLMGVLSGGAALRESIAVDEVAHIGAGVSYLQKLDMRMNPEHPPLAKLLAALPLVLRGVHADYSERSWPFATHGLGGILAEWSWGNAVALKWNDPFRTLMWARAPMLLLTLLMGVFLYRYASQFGGPWGGVLCVTAYVTTPAFLVFGPLVLTDVAITFFALLTLWRFATLWRNPNRANIICFGLAFGTALLSKFSSGLLLFAFLAFRLSLRYRPFDDVPRNIAELYSWRGIRGRAMWKGIGVAALTVYVVYFILSWNQPSDDLHFLGQSAASLVLRRLLMPALVYLRGLLFFALASSRPTFVLGHNYSHGVWFYFPIIFALKSTLAFLLMLALGIPLALVARRKLKAASLIPSEMEFHWRAIWISLLVFVAACMVSRMTISIRHFTIPIVLLILLLSPLPRAMRMLLASGWSPARFAMALYALLAVWSVVTVLRAYPYYFPFINSLRFEHPAYELVNDSNLDWNQALPEAAHFVQQRGLSRVLLDEYGYEVPSVYIPQAQVWNCQEAVPSDGGQWAIVSAGMIEDAHNCRWLLHYPHQALAGGGMYAFELPAVIPAPGDPSGPPLRSDYHDFGIALPDHADSRIFFLRVIRDSSELQPTMDEMMAIFRSQRKH